MLHSLQLGPEKPLRHRQVPGYTKKEINAISRNFFYKKSHLFAVPVLLVAPFAANWLVAEVAGPALLALAGVGLGALEETGKTI